ncbi:5-bromo-4-chloroindolyl phosphate hydrolysis family protein [Sinirhodobacter sp. WL0062]|uniref:5-bromo-4-chloroindolyl phosphate hydrolysis family protein n=1 Tax=Rhodobacter flavimaris TaxID=2907145 RepID=A0ABS8YX64_9RHOB|nr:5-bromo-4-chloroindolyl phosphate hydrolysis family protein [Sinirhodobacter sp. WL0062]MCE5974394.1 5-bromo-4-chloroindolyl phosphate hydrolysis family protein [Sinirhodobacter sp. WL0062]
MAQRYGGKYSPDPQETSEQTHGTLPPERMPRVQHRQEGWPFWIAVAALPFVLGAIGTGPTNLVRSIGAFGVIALSAWLLREGLKAEAAYDARRVARRPALPRKILGALLLGAGLALGATDASLPGAGVIGLIGAALSLVAFGPDPMRDKGIEGIDRFQQDRVARVVAEGEKHLNAMREAIARAQDSRLSARVEAFAATARQLFRAVEEDPGDLAAARRYMGVYLEGARDATIRFVDLWGATRDPDARRDYEALLTDLEENFTARTRRLIENGREGLEVEIEVLRERLARDNLTPPRG